MRMNTKRVSPSEDWHTPVGGWRTDVETADMPKDSAYLLDNFFPEANRIRARYGSNIWASGLGANVQTVIPYSGASNKLFAAANGQIFDVTNGNGLPVGSAVVTGQTQDHWSYQQFTNASGIQFMRLVNGTDLPLLYDGTTWTNNILTGTATLSTQSVLVKNVPYTLSIYGTGSVSLTGTYTGTLAGTGVSNRVTLTFTPGAGTLNVNVTGTVTSAQLERGSPATPYTPSTMITGPADPSVFIACVAYRSRLWFIEKNTTNLWYLATDAVSGAATKLPVGGLMKYGGTLVAIGVWTVPQVNTVLQTLVLLTSEGEILVFQGSDPSSSTTWSLMGTFKIGRPLGTDRCLLNVGADLAIMTTDGIVPISKAVQMDRGATDLGAITAHIGPTWRDTVAFVGTTDSSWQLTKFPKRQMAIVNIPSSYGPYQYVMNTETGAWCRFAGLNTSCWSTWQDRIFFGSSDGNVYEAEVGASDNGTPIDALMVGAWDQYKDGFSSKHTKLIGVNAQVGISTVMFAGVSADYVVNIPTAVLGSTVSGGLARWGSAVWGVDVFPGSTLQRKYASAGAVGFALAPTIRALISGTAGSASISEATVVGGALLFEKGQPL